MNAPLKALLVGCGGISHLWVEAALTIPNFELVAFVDLNEAAAKKRAEEYGKPTSYIGTSFENALQLTQPDIVFDCTFPASRTYIVTTALESGCHVLSEKPLADSMDNARKMIETAQQAGKTFAVMQNRRHDSNIARVKQVINDNTLGALTLVNSDFFIAAHFGGIRDEMPHILLHDMAIHTFDAARFISGADAVSVYCKEWNPRGSWYQGAAAAVAIFEMSNGSVYTYRGSWVSEGLHTTWESDWRIVGEQGSLKWDGAQDIRAEVIAKREGFMSTFSEAAIPEGVPLPTRTGHGALIQDFVDCVRTGRTPQTVCSDNIKSLAMVFAAIQSAEEKREVKIDW